eukprot:TRINITY_DN16578_c0_g2_i1.p2 TRINITY_DN16578_c0_g2~~TRINITY_DN16578_c0_g2_i1.p2  ORF type:complete len:203 (-),score=25.89 TRINITY_DN16578_c0_g2_i1:187-795(-)
MPRGVHTAAKQVAREIDPARIERLKTFFARASVATRLLHSRLALPITYPLNSAMMGASPAITGQKDDKVQQEVTRGLAHVTPIVTGMSKVAPLLKAVQGLSHYQGGLSRGVAQPAGEEVDMRLDFLRPEYEITQNYGRGKGHIATKTGKGTGWDDVASGRTVDSPQQRRSSDPFETTPALHEKTGTKFVSKTKWNPKRSGSQ